MPGQNSGGGLILLLFLIIVLVAGYIIIAKPQFISDIKGMYTAKTSGTAPEEDNTPVIIEAPKENSWCKIQEMPIRDTREDPISDKIIGWDSVNDCCAREVYGWNCALKVNNKLEYCFTSMIGGEVKWVNIDNIYQNTTYYKDMVWDYDKYEIPNKVCDVNKYLR